MSDVIITVENLGKKYRISHQSEGRRYVALRDVIAQKAVGLFKKLKSLKTEKLKSAAAGPISAFQDVSVSAFKGGVSGTEDFWALKNVSFEVKRGEVVGIIGRNGAGKSTLLKILSRITEPTTGRVHLRGRVASLLEVGTGFHPELTGRENIFLNGAILGMSRAEIRKKFDEIVAFAEVEKFLDTPVKRYSSGMYVRLAFAVAAHLEPEILIVDEVLAVGDAEFQKKCLGKMNEVAKGGRTVLFVSHNMAAVQSLCSSGLLLSRGRLVFQGSAGESVARYLNSDACSVEPFKYMEISKAIGLTRLEATPTVVRCNNRMTFTLELQTSADEIIADLMLEIYSVSGQLVSIIDLRSAAGPYRLNSGAKLVIRSHVAALPFVESDFNLALYINAASVCRSFTNLLVFSVLPAEFAEGVVPREPRFRGLIELNKRVEAMILG
jgi:lipopolysaccharide transport system ATP-binding protein